MMADRENDGRPLVSVVIPTTDVNSSFLERCRACFRKRSTTSRSSSSTTPRIRLCTSPPTRGSVSSDSGERWHRRCADCRRAGRARALDRTRGRRRRVAPAHARGIAAGRREQWPAGAGRGHLGYRARRHSRAGHPTAPTAYAPRGATTRSKTSSPGSHRRPVTRWSPLGRSSNGSAIGMPGSARPRGTTSSSGSTRSARSSGPGDHVPPDTSPRRSTRLHERVGKHESFRLLETKHRHLFASHPRRYGHYLAGDAIHWLPSATTRERWGRPRRAVQMAPAAAISRITRDALRATARTARTAIDRVVGRTA